MLTSEYDDMRLVREQALLSQSFPPGSLVDGGLSHLRHSLLSVLGKSCELARAATLADVLQVFPPVWADVYHVNPKPSIAARNSTNN